MAEARAVATTRMVEVKEVGVQLNLNSEEAVVLAMVLRRVGGGMRTSLRKHSNDILQSFAQMVKLPSNEDQYFTQGPMAGMDFKEGKMDLPK